MEQKDLEKIIKIIINNEIDAEAVRLIIELVKAVNKPAEIKTIPDPYPVYPPSNPYPYNPCTPQWDWTTKINCTGIDPSTNESTEVKSNATVH